MRARDKKGVFIKEKADKYDNCHECGNFFKCRRPSLYGVQKYCSISCQRRAVAKPRKGKPLYKITDEIRGKISKSKKGVSLWGGKREGMTWLDGENHHFWKGDDVSYRNLHRWVEKHKGRTNSCSYCNTPDLRRSHLANISHEYRRDVNDFIELCPSCHSKYDTGKISQEELLCLG